MRLIVSAGTPGTGLLPFPPVSECISRVASRLSVRLITRANKNPLVGIVLRLSQALVAGRVQKELTAQRLEAQLR